MKPTTPHTFDTLHQALVHHKRTALKHIEQEQWPQAVEHGTLSLDYESQWVCQQAGPRTNLIAFSLYGNDPLYCETALLNAQILNDIYPNWTMRVYHDSSVPQHVLKRLHQHHVELIHVDTLGIGHWPGTFWRFAAASDPHAERILFRDADSIIGKREAHWVQNWLNSPHPFHIMRDWYSHTDLILAGLWGAYAPLLTGMIDWVNQYLLQTPKLHPTHADQVFLAEIIWPKIHHFSLVHDTAHPTLAGTTPIHSPHEGTHASDALGGFKAKLVSITLPPNTTHYHINITDDKGALIQYERAPNSTTDEYYLPSHYYDLIQAGLWTLEHTLPAPTFTMTITKPNDQANPTENTQANTQTNSNTTQPSAEQNTPTIHITATRSTT